MRYAPGVGKRRHFGGIRHLPSGHWQATYWLDGKQHASTHRTKADAHQFLSAVEVDISRGQWIDPIAGRITFRKYAESWLERRSDLKPTTRARYRGLLDRHLLDMFGDVPLAQLKPGQVRSWHGSLRERHPSTAAGAYRLLNTIYISAVREEVVARSPCRIKGGGSEHATERTTATDPEAQAAVNAMPEGLRCALLLATWCQLRRGEILGLQRQDIDLGES
jgi:integrase